MRMSQSGIPETRNRPSRRRSVFRLLGLALLGVGFFPDAPSAQEKTAWRIDALHYLDNTPVRIEIEGDRIGRIIRLPQSDPAAVTDPWVAPGFIDNQVNGYASVGFASPGLTVDGIRKVTRAMWTMGVTTYVPTLTTASRERFLENLAVLAQAVRDPELARSIPGFHMEGPFISPVDGFRGAHPKAWVRKPDWDEFLAWNRAADGKIVQVTLAPEAEGAVDFIRKCTALGIVAALGHHNGSADQIRQAVDAGACVSTHLGNGCANTIHRHDNPLWPQLADGRLMASCIADGFHLRPEEVQVFFKVKGPDRLFLTTDIVEMAGMPPGEYRWEGQTVLVTPEGKLTIPAQNVLAGASMPIGRGIRNVLAWTGCSLADAVHMASRNQARLLKLENRGELRSGKRADLVLFKLEKEGIRVFRTVLAGKTVYDAARP